MNGNIEICVCTNGPVLLSGSNRLEHKYTIAIADYDKTQRHKTLISCKTTSKGHGKIYPGEFMVEDFFGLGPSKIQPYNIVRIPISDLSRHKKIGALDKRYQPFFKTGLQIAIAKRFLNPSEVLRVLDSWSHILPASKI